jgi:hypothetical protein
MREIYSHHDREFLDAFLAPNPGQCYIDTVRARFHLVYFDMLYRTLRRLFTRKQGHMHTAFLAAQARSM